MARRQSEEAGNAGALPGNEYKHGAAWSPMRWGPLRRLTHRAKLCLLALVALGTLTVLYLYGPMSSSEPPAPGKGVVPVPDIKQQPGNSWVADSDNGAPEEAKKQHQPPKSSLCSELPIPGKYWNMTGAESAAFVVIPKTDEIGVGSSVCVRVVVPAKALAFSVSFVPFPDTPWDSILLDLVGGSTGISVPVPLQMADSTQNYHRDTTHVYEADVVLRDADIYRPVGYIEYRGALWNGEDHLETQPLNPETLTIPESLAIAVTDTHGDDSYSIAKHPTLPLCTSADADGRWVSVGSLPFDKALVPPPDNNNRVWLPYTCRLQRYTYQGFAKCLAQHYPLVHWYGDSNTRRAMKKITTFGKWCSTPEDMATDLCRCSDNAEAFGNINLNAPIVSIDLKDPGSALPAGQQNALGSDKPPQITLFRWGGLTTRNEPAWANVFTENGGIKSKWGSPSAAIVGLINWDVAFSTRSFFITEVEKLVEHIATSYSDTTDIILRTGQYFCCSFDTNTAYRRKFSRLRVQYFNQYLVDIFRRRLGKQRRIFVWDVALPFERRPFQSRDEESKSCSPNHARAEIIELENQLLFNAMCNQLFD